MVEFRPELSSRSDWCSAGALPGPCGVRPPPRPLGNVYVIAVRLNESHAQFLIVRNLDMGQVIYPLAENAGADAQVVGPDDLMYETQWLLQGHVGDVFRIELELRDQGPAVRRVRI